MRPVFAATLVAALVFSLTVIAFYLTLAGANQAWAATPPPLLAAHGAVASDHIAASSAGLESLRAGGNAADAACATALALGVVSPQGSGLGGGGFALIYVAKEGKVFALDFRETAPAALKPELFVREGKVDRRLSVEGGLAVGVPGEAKGLGELVRRWGKLPFSACVRPAERLANGVPATPQMAETIRGAAKASPDRARFLSEVFVAGRPLAELRAGDLLRRPALAATLKTLRREGPGAFYKGRIAAAIVAAVAAGGGVMTLADLQGYAVLDRTPLATSYRDYRIFSMPPPSSGGIVLAQGLGILNHRFSDPAARGHNSSAYLHLVAESLKHGFADRARHLGDPAFVEVPMAKLLDTAYHRELAGRIDEKRVLPPERYGTPASRSTPPKDAGTAHLSVIDAEGNAVALTTTVNLEFGAHLVAGHTGIVLNNQIDDFSLAPDLANAFGLIGNEKNAVAPGKRPLSSMSPTIVLQNGRVRMVVGAAGGPRIISSTFQVLLNVLDWKMDAQAASAAPRIHHQWSPNVLHAEKEISRDVLGALEARGHRTEPRESLGRVNVIVRTEAGVLEAASEFRSGGAPAGY